jgi:hypothetical protein
MIRVRNAIDGLGVYAILYNHVWFWYDAMAPAIIYYNIRTFERKELSWHEVPQEIRNALVREC